MRLPEPDPARLDPAPGAPVMTAVVTTGHGGCDRLALREVRRPEPGPGEVLLRVLAAGVNNTEINTRLGWYSAAVTGGTEATAGAAPVARDDGGWNRPTPFPFIQGTDCCGRIAAVGAGVDPGRIGERVIVRASMALETGAGVENVWLGSDIDGAFAQYVAVPAAEAFTVDSAWSDAELAAIPCAYGTAENMLARAGVGEESRVLIAGASGGVGAAAVQLARLRGAEVIAEAGAAKRDAVAALGAAQVIDRGADPVAALGAESVDVVVDNVGGAGFVRRLEALRRRGAYVSSGAIAGPVVSLDMRVFYLKDLRLIGCTAWDAPVFPALIRWIEADAFRPPVAGAFPLAEIAEVQRRFLDKRHVGKLVLIPPDTV
mgnify:CR=1 FL=1